MEKVQCVRESETQVGRLIAGMRLKEPRRFQCRVCRYTFEMLPCAHGLRGKDLKCPECGGKLKRIDDYGCEGHCSPEDCEVCGKCER
jgi:hypothetical protein